jgi:hypothetical protein
MGQVLQGNFVGGRDLFRLLQALPDAEFSGLVRNQQKLLA